MKYYIHIYLFSIILTLVCSFHVYAQDLSYRQFTTDDGLPSNHVYAVHQDRHGFIWLGTENGLSRYDGKSFVNYTIFDGLPDTEILSIYEDSQNRMWFGTLNGKIGYYQNGHFYNEKNTDFLKGCQLKWHIQDITEDKEGNIYFLSILDIIRINKNNEIYTRLPLSNSELAALFDSDSTAVKAKLDAHLTQHLFSKLILDKEGTLCIVLSYGSLAPEKIYRFPDFKLIDFNLKNFDKKNLIKVLITSHATVAEIFDFDKKNLNIQENHKSYYCQEADNLWLFGVDTPLQLIQLNTENPSKKSKLLYTSDKINSTRAIIDHNKSFWVGSQGDGLFRFDQPYTKVYKTGEQLQGNNMNSMFIDKATGLIYCGSDDGVLNVITKNSPTIQSKDYSSTIARIRAIYKDINNQLWLISNRNFTLVNQKDLVVNIPDYVKKNILGQIPIPGKSIFYKESEKKLYLSTTYGIHTIDFNTSTPFVNKMIPVRKAICSYVNPIDKTYWIGTGNGLFYRTYKSNENDIKPTKFNDPITYISQVDTKLVIGTKGKGVLVIDKNGQLIRRLTTNDGLASNLIRAIHIDEQKNIWIATNKGISFIENIDAPKFKTITMDNGLLSNDVLACEIYEEHLYVLSPQGLALIDVSQIQNSNQPKLYIEQILVNNEQIPQDSISKLSHQQNNLLFRFAGIDFGDRDQLAYQYKLHGFHKEWQHTKNNELLFEQIPPGDYTLELYALKDDLRSEATQTIAFCVMPAWYQTTLVRFLGIVLANIIISYLIIYFVKRERKKNQIEKRLLELEQIALQSQMNPHFIKNSLGAIQYFMLEKDFRLTNKYLNIFANLITTLLGQANQSLITIYDEINLLELYLSMEKLRFDDNFEYNIHCQNPEILSLKIPSMMIQPLVENSILHGFRHRQTKGINKINIEIIKKGDYLICMVEDNGCGIQATKKLKNQIVKKQGLAIKNIKERISLLAATHNQTSFSIIKSDDKGTLIKLELPIFKDDKNNNSRRRTRSKRISQSHS